MQPSWLFHRSSKSTASSFARHPTVISVRAAAYHDRPLFVSAQAQMHAFYPLDVNRLDHVFVLHQILQRRLEDLVKLLLREFGLKRQVGSKTVTHISSDGEMLLQSVLLHPEPLADSFPSILLPNTRTDDQAASSR